MAAGAFAPRILTPTTSLQCVPYARAVSGIQIHGDAWTWWRSAEGRYRRDRIPRKGAVLVLSRTTRLRGGHLAVVSRLVSARMILVEHANWLNLGRIHKDTPILDVSPGNDWSQVRVWYVPGKTLGARTYAAEGFIHPQQQPMLEQTRLAPAQQGETRSAALSSRRGNR